MKTPACAWDSHPGAWFSFNPDDPSYGPRYGVPVWLTDGERTTLAVRIPTPEKFGNTAIFQTVLGFEPIERPTHFSFAAPIPPFSGPSAHKPFL